MDPEKKSLNFIFPTKHVIPESLKFSHWPSKELNRHQHNISPRYLKEGSSSCQKKPAVGFGSRTVSQTVSMVFASLEFVLYSNLHV